MMSVFPADPGTEIVLTPMALKVPGAARSEPPFLAHGLARFSSPSSPSSGSPQSRQTLQLQSSLIQQLCAPSVTQIVLPMF